MKSFDWIILGGGCAGLSLANHMTINNLKGDILIIEKDEKDKNDRTWCFWEKNEFYPEDYQWSEGIIQLRGTENRFNLKANPYRLVRSKQFYNHINQQLNNSSSITILRESVQEIKPTSSSIQVRTDKDTYEGKWIFNSLIQFAPISQDVIKGLKQHFLGLWVKTKNDQFDSNAFTLMDFSVTKTNEVQFVYILPISSREALIEYTVFSDSPWKEHTYLEKIQEYILQKFKITDFEITEKESGIIPMSSKRFKRLSNQRVIHIGTAGGITKASTGYTFQRIQEDSQQIASNLKKQGTPFPLTYVKNRFRFYDRLLLWLIENHPEKVPDIFVRLFSKVSISRTLRFLSEKTLFIEEVAIFFKLPWVPFLKALRHEYFTVKSSKSLGSISKHHNSVTTMSQLID